MNFNDFWKWLQRNSGPFNTLGGGKQFTVQINPDGLSGNVMSSSKTPHKFSKTDAQRTWDRFFGLKQAEDFFLSKKLFAGIPKKPYLMPGSYELPGNKKKPYPQNWLDCPNTICCPWIAATIRDFLATHKQTNND
jgi:hypothetical protein